MSSAPTLQQRRRPDIGDAGAWRMPVVDLWLFPGCAAEVCKHRAARSVGLRIISDPISGGAPTDAALKRSGWPIIHAGRNPPALQPTPANSSGSARRGLEREAN